MRYYISDLHFFHDALNKNMDRRGFESAEAMNEYMIEKWNAKVRKKDEVVILGDFAVTAKGEEVNEVLNRLKGKKYLIIGNHERYLTDKTFDPSAFGWALPYKEMNDNDRRVVLSHYPIMCYDGQYRLTKDGKPKSYMLYGHVHNTFDEYLVNEHIESLKKKRRILRADEPPVSIPCNMINCFCMFSDYTPLTLDEWIEVDEKRRAEIKPEEYGAQK